MKVKKTLLLVVTALTVELSIGTPVQAARYSKSEAKTVRKFQRRYHELSQVKYNESNIYLQKPHFNFPFFAGKLDPFYVPASMDYINYYRSLVGLPEEANNDTDNINAQIGAAALASVNAAPNLQAHGLLNYVKPDYISDDDWDIAENSTLGNLNFLKDGSATAGEIVTYLLREDNNIAGKGNIGHRALILSTRATRMGIGAAYGRINNTLYSVENGLFADDILRDPVKNRIVYPANYLFPYELVGKNTPWSYSTTDRIAGKPKIYITDLSLKKKRRYSATQVKNFGTMFYGEGYTTTITYRPSKKTKLVNTHKYRVQIGNHYTYTFRFFRQNGKLK